MCIGLEKPLFKESLKNFSTEWAYVRFLTTHVTFLCREHAHLGPSEIAAAGSMCRKVS